MLNPAAGQGLSDEKIAKLTVLVNADRPRHPQRKRFTRAGVSKEKNGFLWTWSEVPIDSFATLATTLDDVRTNPLATVVPGRVRDDVRDNKKIRRRKNADPKGPATIEDAGSQILFLDLDDTLPIVDPYGWHNTKELAQWAWSVVVDRVPALAGVSVWWQASGSAGVKGKDREARLHFFALIDEPLFETQRRQLYAIAGTDQGLATLNQKCLIADPEFDGIPDPLEGQPRSGVIYGNRDQASAQDLIALIPEPVPADAKPRPIRTLGTLPDPSTFADTTTSAGEKILMRAETRIADADQRNVEINRQAFFVGEAIARGEICRREGESRLKIAARKSGTGRPDEAVDNGLDAGLRSVSAEGQKPPSQAVWDLVPTRLSSRRQKDLKAALQGVCGVDDAATVLAVGAALSNKIPTAADMETIRSTITGEIPTGVLSDEWIDAIMKRVGKSVEHRKRRALSPVTFSPGGRHADDVDHIFVDELTPMDQIDGVVVVRAPMAKGKTQLIGRPWIEAAKATGADIYAVAHRRSLIGELAQRLGLADYRSDDALTDMEQKGGLAVCLPSITLSPWDLFTPGYVFIDEIAQVLRFLTAKDYCRTREATAAGVFEQLVDLVRNARGVLVADAGADDTVIDFIRHCRPGERIRVVEMRDDIDAGIAATFYAGDDKARADAVDEIAAELVSGGRVWVACEGATMAKDVGEHLRSFTSKVLVLTADTKIGEAEAAFFADPEGESRKYDAIIASPVVSSGLSIEHRGNPHFTFGAFLGSGGAITPADAAQQLRRVRYLDRFAVGVMFNNRIGGQTAEAIIEGREAAAQDEGRPVFSGSFDRLVAGYQAVSANARADFAAGLWWLLESAGWTVSRAEGGTNMFAKAKGKIAEDRKAQRAADLVAACDWLPYTTEGEIEDLRRSATTSEQLLLIDAWDLTKALGVARLDADDVAFLDDGGLGRIDMFEDLIDRTEDLPEHAADTNAVLIHRRLRRARRKHFAEIFEGVDVMAKGWLSRDVADQIVDRIMARADAYAASGAVPPRWRSRYGDKPAPRPQNTVKAVQDLIGRAGVGMSGKMVRVSREGPSELNGDGGSRDNRMRIFSLDQEDVEAMRLRVNARKRAAEQIDRDVALLDSAEDTPLGRSYQPHVAHIAEANRIEQLKKSGEIRAQILLFDRPSPVGLDAAPLKEILCARNCHARPLTR